jgi:hypothetical protein
MQGWRNKKAVDMDKEDIKPKGHFDILEVQMARDFFSLSRTPVSHAPARVWMTSMTTLRLTTLSRNR